MSAYDNIRSLFNGDLTRNIFQIIALITDELEITNNAAATLTYVDYPGRRVQLFNTDALVFTDAGKVVCYTHAGAVAVDIDDMSAEYAALDNNALELVITMVCENASTALIVTPGAGVTINGSGSAWSPTAGYGVFALVSRDGVNWFHA